MIRLAVLYDSENWAYHRRAVVLERYAPPDIHVAAMPIADFAKGGQADVVLLLDYIQTASFINQCPGQFEHLIVAFNADSKRRDDIYEMACQQATYVICNSLDRFRHKGRFENVCCITNGVDLDTFRNTRPVSERPHRVLWCGPVPSRPNKGREIMATMQDRFSSDGYLFDLLEPERDARLTLQEMAEWYNTGSYILCASESEATANTVMEGAACGCIPVTTNVGNVLEWGQDRVNCCIVRERTPEAFFAALNWASPRRATLSTAGRRTMLSWHWRKRVSYYYALVRAVAAGSRPAPFLYSDLMPGEMGYGQITDRPVA